MGKIGIRMKRDNNKSENKHKKFYKSINFLEHTLWTPSTIKRVFSAHEDSSKYRIYSNKKMHLPNYKDIDILNFLLYKQQLLDKNILTFKSIYEIEKGMGFSHSHKNYDNIRNALVKWTTIVLEFPDGVFYSTGGKRKGCIISHVIDTLVLPNKESNEIIIRFNKEFIEANSEGNYVKTFPLKFMQSLSPLSKRLYEILCKNYEDFTVGVDSLIEKLCLLNKGGARVYKSVIYRKVQKSINEINKKAEESGIGAIPKFSIKEIEQGKEGSFYKRDMISFLIENPSQKEGDSMCAKKQKLYRKRYNINS